MSFRQERSIPELLDKIEQKIKESMPKQLPKDLKKSTFRRLSRLREEVIGLRKGLKRKVMVILILFLPALLMGQESIKRLPSGIYVQTDTSYVMEGGKEKEVITNIYMDSLELLNIVISDTEQKYRNYAIQSRNATLNFIAGESMRNTIKRWAGEDVYLTKIKERATPLFYSDTSTILFDYIESDTSYLVGFTQNLQGKNASLQNVFKLVPIAKGWVRLIFNNGSYWDLFWISRPGFWAGVKDGQTIKLKER